MADETPAPLSDAEIAWLAHVVDTTSATRDEATFKPGEIALQMDVWQIVRRLLATITALQRQVDAAHLDVAYQVTAGDALTHTLHEANAARDRQIDDLTHERDQLLSGFGALVPYQGAWLPHSARDMLRERDAEIDRMRTENAAYREFAEAIAEYGNENSAGEIYYCRYCEADEYSSHFGGFQHLPGCLTLRARALLGTPAPDTGATGQS